MVFTLIFILSWLVKFKRWGEFMISAGVEFKGERWGRLEIGESKSMVGVGMRLGNRLGERMIINRV